MILNPWIIAMVLLLTGLSVLYLYALFIAIQIARRWDIRSMDDRQLMLERRTHLAATIIRHCLWIQVISLVLFYMTLESISEVIPGAMCATGALQASDFGFPALYAKIAVSILCVLWICIHFVDSRLEDYRLTPLKFKSLFFLVPLVFVDFTLQSLYFLDLDPEIISSCCGVVFEMEGEGLGASVASLAPYPVMLAFYGSTPVLFMIGWMSVKKGTPWGYYAYSTLGTLFFILSVVAVISFISPYIYESPTLHCPFCLMRKEHHYLGYLLYMLLFGAFLLSLLPGLLEFLKARGSAIAGVVDTLQKRALNASLVLWILFVLVPTLVIVGYEIRSPGGHLFGSGWLDWITAIQKMGFPPRLLCPYCL